MYGKVFNSIYTGTLRGKLIEQAVFICMIANSDSDGFVDISHRTIAEHLGITTEQAIEATAYLEAPDPQSRSEDEGGRRIIRVSSKRIWGWQIVNKRKYDDIRSIQDRRRQNREAQSRHRANSKRISKGKQESAQVSSGQHESARSAHIDVDIDIDTDKDSVGGITTPKDSTTLPQLYTEQEFTRPIPKRPDEPKIEPTLERISVDLSGEIASIKHFAVEVRDRARELTTAFAFRAYGSLPNLSKPIMQQAALHIATTIDAYGEQATQRWRDYFAAPPPQHPKDLAPWHIRAYLGLDPAKPSAMFEPLDAKQTEAANRERMLDIIKKKRKKGSDDQ